MSSLSNNKFNSTLNDYLLNCDLLNKYNLSNIHTRPSLEKIVFHFPLKAFVVGLDNSESNINNQVKAFLLFYIFFSLLSYINFQKIKVSRGFIKGKDTEGSYSLKVVLTNKEDIDSFLINMFIENSSKFQKESIVLTKKSFATSASEQQNLCYNTTVPGKVFLDVEDFFKNLVKGNNIKDFNINISFLYKNKVKLLNDDKLIKNLSFFWING